MRVWLTEWEWACCGDAFEVGDDVTMTVTAPPTWIRDTYGELGASIDRQETHHEQHAGTSTPERIRGRVRAIDEVYLRHSVTREPIGPRVQEENAARFDEAARAADGETFGWFAYAPGSAPRYTESWEPIPGATRTVPGTRVPTPMAPEQDSRELLSGYVVDLDPLSAEG